MKITRLLGTIAFCAAFAVQSLPSGAKGLNCSPSSFRSVSAPKMRLPESNGFRILWHVATQIEQIADADAAAIADIRETQKKVDGYYVNAILRGPITYWPGRPAECSLNNKIRTAQTNETCGAGRKKMLQKLGYDNETDLQVDGMKRAAEVLGLAKEQSRGKIVMTEMLVNDIAMTYVPQTDSIKLNELPASQCLLNAMSVTPDAYMVYQEPAAQVNNGKYLWVPRKDAGKVAKSAQPKADKIPENTRVFGMIDAAYRQAGIPFGNIFPNIRSWNRKSPGLVGELAAIPSIAGYNFEGGSRLFVEEPRKVEAFARGVAWSLQNTKDYVSILMPGYWPDGMTGTTEGIDTLPKRVRDYVLALNDKLSGITGKSNAICNGRIILVPASYGRPVHVSTLPSMRNNSYAGTVTGEIRMLADLRKKLCG
jgi:hypothetical protein